MMNSARWAEITNSFSLERGKDVLDAGHDGEAECITARSRMALKSTPPRSFKTLTHEKRGHNNNEKRRSITSSKEEEVLNMETIKAIIEEKNARLKVQEQIILSLKKAIHLNAENKSLSVVANKTKESFTQTDEPIHHDATEGSIQKLVSSKIDSLEKRLEALILVLQSGNGNLNSQGCFLWQSLNNNDKNAPIKSWNKPPTLFPKSTYSSSIREIHCRGRFTADPTGGTGMYNAKSTNGNMSEQGKIDVEARVCYLESLVDELKNKFIKLMIYRKN